MDNKKQIETDNNSLESIDTSLSTSVINDPSKSNESNESLDTGVVNPDSPTHTLADKKSLFLRIRNHVNIYFILLLFALLILGVVVYVSIIMGRSTNKEAVIQTQKLNQSSLDKLSNTDSVVGDATQTLTVQSNAIFNGGVLVDGALEVAGTLKIGGSLSLPSLTVGGKTTVEQLAAKSLTVSSDAAVQGKIIGQNGLAITGAGSFSGQLSAGQILTDKLVLGGDMQLTRHITTTGGSPSRSNGSALGGGGTASNSGTDTAGTVAINTGNSAPAGCFVSLSFTNSFSAVPHVIISPASSNAAGLDYYTTRTTTGFSICTASDPPDNASNMVFDYIVLG